MRGFVWCIPSAGMLGRYYLRLLLPWTNNNTMGTHVLAYALSIAVFISSFQASNGDTGNLLQVTKKKSIRHFFHAAKWKWIKPSGSAGFFATCGHDDPLNTTEMLNTTSIKELTVDLEYEIKYLNQSDLALNRTMLLVGVTDDSHKMKLYNVTGTRRKGSKYLGIQLLQVNSRKVRFSIVASLTKCLYVYNVSITYKFCPRQTFNNLASFPRTSSPEKSSPPVKVNGKCNFSLERPVAYCSSSGYWVYNKTVSCPCGPGYISSTSGSCIRLTGKIQGIKAVRKSDTSALLSWRPQPIPSIKYNMICNRCQDGKCSAPCPGVKFKPLPDTSDGMQRKRISGLKPGSYLVTLVAMINVSNNSDVGHSWNTSVDLLAMPGKARNITYTSQVHNEMVLSWLPPLEFAHYNISYEVTCQMYCANCSEGCSHLKFNPSRDNLLQTSVTITGFSQEGKRYLFKVFTKHQGWVTYATDGPFEWNFVAVNFTAESKEKIPVTSKKFNVVDVIIGVSVLIMAVVIAVVVTRCYNRWKARKRSSSFDAENTEQLFNGEGI